MIGHRPGIFIFASLSLLAPAPLASSWGLPLLEIAQIQREADYVGTEHLYFNPTFGLVALGIGAVFGLAWLLGGEPAARLRGDPVPSRIRGRLDRLDSATLAVLAAVRAAKAQRPEAELEQEKATYDRLAKEVGELLDKVRLDLLLNFVDDGLLVVRLDDLFTKVQDFSFQLRRLAPVKSIVADPTATLPLGHSLIARIGRGWERVLSPGSAKMTTIRQLNTMRWPAWSRIETAQRGPI
jgi:hypothetical protein